MSTVYMAGVSMSENKACSVLIGLIHVHCVVFLHHFIYTICDCLQFPWWVNRHQTIQHVVFVFDWDNSFTLYCMHKSFYIHINAMFECLQFPCQLYQYHKLNLIVSLIGSIHFHCILFFNHFIYAI